MRGAESPKMERHPDLLSSLPYLASGQGDCFLPFPRLGSSQGSCSCWSESELLQVRGKELVGLSLLPGLEPLAEPGSPRVGAGSSFQAWAEVKECSFVHRRKSPGFLGKPFSQDRAPPFTDERHPKCSGLLPFPLTDPRAPSPCFNSDHFTFFIPASQIVSPCTSRGAGE